MNTILKKLFQSVTAFLCSLLILASPGVNAKANLADGEYSISYTVLSGDNQSASIANDYFIKPAKLIVQNGTMKVQLTMKNSSWITEFQSADGGNRVISRNKAANTRTVQFNIADLSSPRKVSMKVVIEDMDYNHSYTTRFSFDQSSIKLTKAYETADKNATSKKESVTAGTEESASNTSSSASQSVSTSEQEDTTTVMEETNPATGDHAPIYLLVLTMVGACILFIHKMKIEG